MDIKLDTLCDWGKRKALFLMKTALDLDMNLDGCGELAVNNKSGNTYLWLKDYPFSLYMPISGELKTSDVWALWSNPENGEEIEIVLTAQTKLSDLYEFCNRCERDFIDQENKEDGKIMNLINSQGMKQHGNRYRVRRDPYFHDLWCIVDRVDLSTDSEWCWQYCKVWATKGEQVHFDDFDDGIMFVKLIEKSEAINK